MLVSSVSVRVEACVFGMPCRVWSAPDNRFLPFPRGPGGFRELREAGRIHFHLSWYLSDYVVTSYDQKPWGDFVVTVHGIYIYMYYIYIYIYAPYIRKHVYIYIEREKKEREKVGETEHCRGSNNFPSRRYRGR